jgi:flagellar biosynthesis protein FlhA
MKSFLEKLTQNSDIALAVGLVAILAVMVIPMPPFMLDLLLSLGIAMSIVLLLTSVYVQRAVEFSVFPSLLLITTLFRLALNVATTRRILLSGPDQGIEAAGDVIAAFGEFVVGGNYAVGVVVFVILVIINFIVITKGAGRVAEVAARFTLDAMPGKQMAIDADLNAGLINEEEARRRRSEIAREAEFYGAMDGASKFVRGDAIAGILIVVVNIIGGIIIGTLQRGMDIGRAAETFTLLTIGDGLVSQIPALIISTAAGIIVTRTGGQTKYSEEFTNQLFRNPKSLMVAAGVLGVMAIVPGMPTLPFLLLAVTLGFTSRALQQKIKDEEVAQQKKADTEKLKPVPEKLENLLNVDLLELEVGYGLIGIVDSDQNGDLLERITNIRKQFALDLGIIVPPLRIRDNLELKPGDYRVLLKGNIIGEGALMVGHLLAMDPGNVLEPVPGIPTKEPAFGLDAIWITDRQKEEATFSGYTVVDLSTVIATHLSELIRQNAHEILGRQELQSLIDSFKATYPKVVEELIPTLLPLGTVLKVLKNLLREGVSIRDLRTILEALADAAPYSKDPMLLTEQTRAALSRMISRKLAGTVGELQLATIDRAVEETVAAGIIQTDQGQQLSLDPDFVRKFVNGVNAQVPELASQAGAAILLCSPLIRPHLKQLLDRFIPNVAVISHNEIAPGIPVKTIGTVRLSHAH